MKFITGAVSTVTVVVVLLFTDVKAELRADGGFIIDINGNWRFGCNKNEEIIAEPKDLILEGTLFFKNNNNTENGFSAGLKNFIIFKRTKEGNYYNLNNCKKFKKLKTAIEKPFLIVYKESGIISGLKFSKDDTDFTKILKYTFASYIQFDLAKFEKEKESNVRFSTEEKTPLGSCPVKYNAYLDYLSDESIGYNIMKTLSPNKCTQKNKGDGNFPDFCNKPSKMDVHSVYKSNFNVVFKGKMGTFKNMRLYFATDSKPFKDTSKVFNTFITMDMNLNGIVKEENFFPVFKDNDAKLVTNLQATDLNESMLKGKTGKIKKLQNVYKALSCGAGFPTTFDRDLVELVLECDKN